MNERGVQVNEPKSDMNLSIEFPIEIQKTIVNRISNDLEVFLSHCLFFDFGIFPYK